MTIDFSDLKIYAWDVRIEFETRLRYIIDDFNSGADVWFVARGPIEFAKTKPQRIQNLQYSVEMQKYYNGK